MMMMMMMMMTTIFVNKHMKQHCQNLVIQEEKEDKSIVMDKIFTGLKVDYIYETEYGLNNGLQILLAEGRFFHLNHLQCESKGEI